MKKKIVLSFCIKSLIYLLLFSGLVVTAVLCFTGIIPFAKENPSGAVGLLPVLGATIIAIMYLFAIVKHHDHLSSFKLYKDLESIYKAKKTKK